MVAAIESTDGPLPLARRRLADAVHSLADPVPVWDHGACHWSDPLYTRLRGAVVARTADRRRVVAGSRAPCRIDVLTLLVDVDTTVAGWEPDGKGTLDRLHQLSARTYRPQDCGLIEDYCAQIERWVLAGAELIGDRQVAVTLRLPCPSCGAAVVHRRNGSGEQVRGWALKASETGCECSACRAFWPSDQFEFLARLLGCAPLPS